MSDSLARDSLAFVAASTERATSKASSCLAGVGAAAPVAAAASAAAAAPAAAASSRDCQSLAAAPRMAGETQAQEWKLELAGAGRLRLRPKQTPSGTSISSALAARLDAWTELRRDRRQRPDAEAGPVSEWSLAHSDFPAVCSRLSQGASASADDALPSWVLKAWQQAETLAGGSSSSSAGVKEPPSEAAEGPAPRYLRETPEAVRESIGTLLPYQEESLRFGLSRGGRMLCGDEMGLGKTLTALALAFEYQEDWPVLVICPPMLRHQWRDQVLHWLGHVVAPGEVQLIMTGKDKLKEGAKFVIVPYSLINRVELQRTSTGSDYKVVICDESHYIKENSAQRTRATLPLLYAARRVALLSGTPSLNNAAELHSQMQAVLGAQLVEFRSFAMRYAIRRLMRYGGQSVEKFVGVQREEELGVLLRHLMIRHRKDEVLTQLPKKRRQRIVVPASDAKALKEAQALAEKSAEEAAAGSVASGSGVDGRADGDTAAAVADESAGGQLEGANQQDLRLAFQRLCDAKVRSTREYVSCLLDGLERKVLLFAHHHAMLDNLEQLLSSRGKKFIRIDGRVAQKQRPALIHQFQQDPETTVAVLAMTACGEGLNLSAASVVVFCELHYVPGVLEQCEARAHRMGQQNMVDVHYVCVEGSIDDRAFKTLTHKKEATSVILDGQMQAFQPEEEAKAPQREAGAERDGPGDFLAVCRAMEKDKAAAKAARAKERAERQEAKAARQEEKEEQRAVREQRQKERQEASAARAEAISARKLASAARKATHAGEATAKKEASEARRLEKAQARAAKREESKAARVANRAEAGRRPRKRRRREGATAAGEEEEENEEGEEDDVDDAAPLVPLVGDGREERAKRQRDEVEEQEAEDDARDAEAAGDAEDSAPLVPLPKEDVPPPPPVKRRVRGKSRLQEAAAPQ
eukprot:TRINITY_DN10350_c1_g1_i1.p1 TRINITY_DN10350_c1_g1~~TRINITY_DN10350_c1_g1_i1.p1  ORF type:complete len:925 (+),score=264.68 TRINITY_DN10350_c1_g1_i1:553-3327(+)